MTTSAYGKSPLFLLDQLHRRNVCNAQIAKRAGISVHRLARLRQRAEIDCNDDGLARRLAAVLAQIDAERAGAR